MKKATILEFESFGEDKPAHSVEVFLSDSDEFNIQQGRGLITYNKNIQTITYAFEGKYQFTHENETEYPEFREAASKLEVEDDCVRLVMWDKYDPAWELHILINY